MKLTAISATLTVVIIALVGFGANAMIHDAARNLKHTINTTK